MIEKFIPKFIKRKLREYIISLKSPNIIYGYKDSNGTLLPSVRWSDTVKFFRKKNIKIEDNVYIGHYVILDGTDSLEIGEGTQFGAWVAVYTHSSHMAIRLYGKQYTQVPEGAKKGYIVKPVKIGRYVFVGTSSVIMPGVTIGDGSFIIPGSHVKSDVPARSIVEGNPAVVVGGIEKLDERYLRKYPELKDYYYDRVKKENG